MVDDIESQIERFAPGFRDLIVAKHIKPPSWYASYNDNYVGGDIGAGAFSLRQIIGRPKLSPNPYSTPFAGVFLCGSSTAPGAGVHGMAGWNSAAAALKSIGMRIDD
jgi:phytoene dehydrogenase-like protein